MGRCEKNIILNPGSAKGLSNATGGMNMMRRAVMTIVIMITAAGLTSCGKVQDKLERINPPHVAREFFEAWKNRDWKTLYRLSHPAFMQKLRMQKLTPEQRRMSDEELFIGEFKREQRLNQDKVMKTYEIRSFSPYKKGDTTLWLDALVNGRKRKIPLTLDGMSLKIDLTRIE